MCEKCGNPFVSRQLVVDYDDDTVTQVSLIQEFADGRILKQTGTPTLEESDQWKQALLNTNLPMNMQVQPVETVRGPEPQASEDRDFVAEQSIDGIREAMTLIAPGSTKEIMVMLKAVDLGIDYTRLQEAFAAGLSAQEILANEDYYTLKSDTLDDRVNNVRPILEKLGMDPEKIRDSVLNDVSDQEFLANIDSYRV